jgi:uncharacterized iron-regulated protein
MKKVLVFLIAIVVGFSASAQLPAYQLFTSKGKKVKYQKMIKKVAKTDVLFFGEYHNNAIAHWLQLETLKSLGQERKLVLGAEMFEADNQDPLNLYLADSIDAKGLDTLARLWNNYKTDYAPLVNYAKTNNLPFVATNIPRRYASMVYRNGFEVLDSLDDLQKSWMAPLPIVFDPNLPQYKAILEMMGGHGSNKTVMAQAIKDATMAHFVYQNLDSNALFIHFNGAFHSDFYEGIVWYLNQLDNTLDVVTISTVTQSQLQKLDKEHFGRADYIVVVDQDVTTTY